MKVIVGLGNPGQTYHGTRHNAGFAVIQCLADRHGVRIDQRIVDPVDERPAYVYGDYTDDAEAVRLLMPLTMMNASGDALKALDADRRDLLIVCDDVNLPVGTIRLRQQGGAGGHHGLESCLQVLGSEEVARLRIGVGTIPLPKELTEFVLSRFEREERPIIQQATGQAAEACEAWIKDGIEVAMNRYNRGQDPG